MTSPARTPWTPDDAQAWLASIVESCDDAIIGKTLDGVIVSWNAGAERLYGYTDAEAVGQPISILMPPEQPDELAGIMDRLRRGQRIEHYQTQRVRKDGSRLDVSVTISPVRDANDVVVGASAVARDITEQRRLEHTRTAVLALERQARAESERAREAAEAANRAKDDFLAMLSHELRAPLNAIAGWLQVLAIKREDPILVERALAACDRNTKLITKLVDDLLDVSRIVAGRLKVDRVPIELLPLADMVVEEMRPVAADKAIDLRATLDPWVGSVLGDPNRLQQVLMNLLGNAFKFTPAGGSVEVRVEAKGDRIHIVVQDTGQGIPADLLPYVFERFRQGNTGIGGLGLGLAIVKHIVEVHGGTVEAHSEGKGQGARFTIDLPTLKDWPPV